MHPHIGCAKAAFVARARCRAFRHYRELDALRRAQLLDYRTIVTPCLSGASEAAAPTAPAAAAPSAAPVVPGPTEIQDSEETEELRLGTSKPFINLGSCET